LPYPLPRRTVERYAKSDLKWAVRPTNGKEPGASRPGLSPDPSMTV
jgi:hypothetical protein